MNKPAVAVRMPITTLTFILITIAEANEKSNDALRQGRLLRCISPAQAIAKVPYSCGPGPYRIISIPIVARPVTPAPRDHLDHFHPHVRSPRLFHQHQVLAHLKTIHQIKGDRLLIYYALSMFKMLLALLIVPSSLHSLFAHAKKGSFTFSTPSWASHRFYPIFPAPLSGSCCC